MVWAVDKEYCSSFRYRVHWSNAEDAMQGFFWRLEDEDFLGTCSVCASYVTSPR